MATGTAATVELLHICGYEVEVMDTGCCGMAGTFGYEVEHYDLSMKVGELKLFPMLRTPTALVGTSPKSETVNSLHSPIKQSGFGGGREGVVVSSGAACRMQIEQGTGVKAIHPIMLVADALKEVPVNVQK
jgi:Fe-S oxidoreductase